MIMSQKLFVMGNFQFRFVVTNNSSLSPCSMSVASLLLRKQPGSLADLEVNVVDEKSASAIFVSRFPISRAGIKRESSL